MKNRMRTQQQTTGDLPLQPQCRTPNCKRRRRRASVATARNAYLSALAIGLMLLSPLFVVVEAQAPAPSFAPSDMPSLIPTRTAASVSGEPTPVPVPDTGDPTTPPDTTPEPTPRPSGALTRAPTRTTPAPSAAAEDPTAQPNLAPTTPRPARRPTRRPSTRSPTLDPTTFSPTAEPTTSPEPSTSTKHPTLSPKPTSLPPTSRPTRKVETQVPSPESTLQKVSDVVSLKLTMEVMSGLMRNRSVLIYEQETTNFIKSSILTQDFGDAGLTYLFVDTIVASQKLVAPSPAPSSASRQRMLSTRRHLQQDSSSSLDSIEVLMDVQVDYRSTNTDYSAAIWVGDAFNSASKRASYIAKLVATKDPTFSELEALTSVLVDGSPPIENPDTPSTSDSNGAMIGIIVGSVVGGILLLALAVVGVKRMGGRDKGSAGSQGHYPTTTTTGSPPLVLEDDPKFTTEILVERQDDISTIGDPFVYGGMMMTEEQRDERTASIGDNYDYANQFQRANSASASGRGQSMMTGGIVPLTQQQQQQNRSGVGGGPVGASVLSDDDSFEQQFAEGDEDDELIDAAAEDQFEVAAPPGKLGMVIDTPNGEIPVVHALKSESVLANQVEVGDHLLSVDGEDVTGMTALEVSKLISLKSDQPRLLVFGRSSSRLGSSSSRRKDP